jgi:hypothetical protein
MNALSATLVEALLAEVDAAYRDGTRLLVLRGNGKNFSAGFDMGGYEAQSEGDLVLRFIRIEQLLQACARALRHARPRARPQFRRGRGPRLRVRAPRGHGRRDLPHAGPALRPRARLAALRRARRRRSRAARCCRRRRRSPRPMRTRGDFSAKSSNRIDGPR